LASLVAGLSLALILALGLMLSTSATTPEMPTTKTTTPGVIITGGIPRDSVDVKVEVFNIKTNLPAS